ncbi:1-acyl-sn-glycerol-3-phosphate acyltransferase [Methylobacillus arboreus]|uniref:lysophospholipid acyltransferase family protein n=1 Tax=Methylobacillus arboreus TaxID=755170 RepID=UPI001E3F6331|nr:lysophospholipid acyltransferase family protein [Methylobacillus arboreus]MCB5191250.1 1-acyl-sn-glycerol-3-phosphate acyltransferase [Methylobacillus arboreus]
MQLTFSNKLSANTCLPDKKTPLAIQLFRLTRLGLHTLYGAAVAATILPSVNTLQRERIIRRWSRQFLNILNIRVLAKGHTPDEDVRGTMFVANHISWLDIHALNSIRTVRFIAKSDIRAWPVIGWLVAQANTLFIERDKRQDASRMVETAAESILAGDCLCYFPEGTTTDGTELRPFKGSLMQAVIDTNTEIRPFSIRYPNTKGSANIAMAYHGETTLWQSLRRVLAQQNPVVELDFAAPIASAGHERRGLCLMARQSIAARLDLD